MKKKKVSAYVPKIDYDACSSIVKSVANILRDHNVTVVGPGYKEALKPLVESLIKRADEMDKDGYSEGDVMKYWLYDVARIIPRLWW